jgi:hypothetical protein
VLRGPSRQDWGDAGQSRAGMRTENEITLLIDGRAWWHGDVYIYTFACGVYKKGMGVCGRHGVYIGLRFCLLRTLDVEQPC